MDRKVFFDLTLVLSARGPAVGLARVEVELAKAALAQRRDVEFVVYSRKRGAFLRPPDGLVRDALGLTGRPLEERVFLSPDDVHLLKAPKRAVYFALQKLRHGALRQGLKPIASLLHAVAKLVYGNKLRAWRSQGGVDLPVSDVCAEPVAFDKNSVLFAGGSDWTNERLDAIAAAKSAHGLAYTLLCYDLMPITHPRYQMRGNTDRFTRFFERSAEIADHIICISDSVAEHARAHCQAIGLAPPVDACALGSDFAQARPNGQLPTGLESGKFVLLVSTVEVRKNHRLAVDVWERLLAEGRVRKSGMKLVFAGRPGWLTQDLMREMENVNWFDGAIVHLDRVSDDLLATLYAECAFTIFPSHYEGYGLPLVESFNAGKLCLSARGGSLAEVAGELSPTLDSHDFVAWVETMGRLIEDESWRRHWEAVIAANYRRRTWRDAAGDMFDLVQSGGADAARGAVGAASSPA